MGAAARGAPRPRSSRGGARAGRSLSLALSVLAPRRARPPRSPRPTPRAHPSPPLFEQWCPDSVNFRLKPVIGASYGTLKEKLTGLGKDVQASDPADLDYEAIKKVLL